MGEKNEKKHFREKNAKNLRAYLNNSPIILQQV